MATLRFAIRFRQPMDDCLRRHSSLGKFKFRSASAIPCIVKGKRSNKCPIGYTIGTYCFPDIWYSDVAIHGHR